MLITSRVNSLSFVYNAVFYVFSLEEMGQTALGPALLVSIVLASKTPGSNVVICTDGLANVGLGRLDNVEKESNYKKASDFYDEIGKFAVEHGYVFKCYVKIIILKNNLILKKHINYVPFTHKVYTW